MKWDRILFVVHKRLYADLWASQQMTKELSDCRVLGRLSYARNRIGSALRREKKTEPLREHTGSAEFECSRLPQKIAQAKTKVSPRLLLGLLSNRIESNLT